jgi:hypothetical protein
MTPGHPAPPQRRNFTLFFLALIGIVVVATFFTFTYFQRQGLAKRRAESRENLREIARRLRSLDPIPEEPAVLILRESSDKNLLTSPSWPDQPGYFFIPGVRSTDPPATLLAYENIPPGKRKIARFVATLDGEINELSDADFQCRLDEQTEAWKKDNRPLRPRLLRGTP